MKLRELAGMGTQSAAGEPTWAETGAVVLDARGISVTLGERPVLGGADLWCRAGEVVALVGPNGAGKSTLLGAIASDVKRSGGEVLLHGTEIDDSTPLELARLRAVLPQQVTVAFPFTVDEVVRMGRAPWIAVDTTVDDETAVAEAIEAMDLAELRLRPVNRLSGGERARVAMARVLAQRTQILLLDEPTAALDIRHQELLLAAVRNHADRGGAAVVVLHDLTQAAAIADRIVVLARGRVLADGVPAVVLNSDLLGDVYGHPVTVLEHPSTPHPVVVADAPISTQTQREQLMTIAQDPNTVPFSIALRDATASDHRSAESNAYLDALLGGDLDRDGYARLAAQHWHIYKALEQVSAEIADDPVGSAFITDALVRLPTLETDLALLLGDDWRNRIDPVPATVAYVDRLIEIGGWVGGIIAHHYTRYLGDLSGGIFIGKRLEKIYEFGDGPGVDFYEFEDIDDANEFKKAYRVALDEADWDADEKLRIIEEARVAYTLNIGVFEDLGEEISVSASDVV